jgi:hypothetical protein
VLELHRRILLPQILQGAFSVESRRLLPLFRPFLQQEFRITQDFFLNVERQLLNEPSEGCHFLFQDVQAFNKFIGKDDFS